MRAAGVASEAKASDGDMISIFSATTLSSGCTACINHMSISLVQTRLGQIDRTPSAAHSLQAFGFTKVIYFNIYDLFTSHVTPLYVHESPIV